MPPNDAGDESPGYEDSSESMEKLQREYLEFAREQMLDLKRGRDRNRGQAMTHPMPVGYATSEISPSIQIRKIDNGWVVGYWIGRGVETFCKTEEIGSFVSKAALDLEKFGKGSDLLEI